MKQYDEYQAINLPWLKSIPAHWSLNRNKVFLQESKDVVGENSKDYTLLSLTLNGIIPRDISSGKGKFPSDFGTYKVIRPNDMVFCLFDIDETPRTVGLSTHNGMLTGAYDVFHVSGINSRYMYYYYLSLDNVKAMRPLYKGLRKTIGVDTFLGAKMPVPPRAEQDQIVRYLDWQVSKINRLIAAKKREIGLLKEHKQTQIADLVLGRNYPAEMKRQSGVMGFDIVPKHWMIIAQKRVFRERIEHSATGTEKLLSVSRHYGVKPADSLAEDEQFATIKPAQSLVGYKIVHKNDLAMNIMRAQNGSYGFSEYEGIISPAYCVYELLPGNDPVYMHHLLKSPQMISVFFASSSGITDHRRRLYPEDFLRIKIALPPIEEQQKIVAQIDMIEASSRGKVEMVQKQIHCLNELRTRLISDVVTGQIDVRDIEIPDFEYTPDNDSMDNDDDADEEEISEQEE